MHEESYPRQNARTHRFTAGAPRGFAISPDGQRVLFVRSASGTDVVGRLWQLDVASGEERLLADPSALHEGPEELSPEERARRERMREGNAGIVGFATDLDLRVAVFALSGGLYLTDSDSPGEVRALDVPGPVVDPRPSPDGRHVAYVSGRSLRVVAADGSDDRCLAAPSHDAETCGLVDFIAAEELDRTRGFWWSPDSDAVLVERVDETPVQVWWISDPVHPDRPPHAHRYPSAGTANALVSLAITRLDGSVTGVEWDATRLPYLVDVSWTSYGDPLLVVMSRDQLHQRVLGIDVATGATSTVADLRDGSWVDAQPGATRWSPDGRLLTLRVDEASDSYRLHLGDDWLTAAGVQVRGVTDLDPTGVTVVLAGTPDSASVVHVGWGGEVRAITPDTGWNLARSAGGTDLVVLRTLDSTATAYEVRSGGRTLTLTSHAEQPLVTPVVTLLQAGDLALPTAVLFPGDHVPGSRRLPVIMSPYGGPHHQEVVSAGASYSADQWFADQGFCVIVADGRGTPGRGPAWDRSITRDFATPVLEDQVAALQAVAQRWPDDIDTDRVGIRGWSFGGYLSALAVLRRPDVFHAAVAGAPVTDWHLYDTAYTERYLGSPATDEGPYSLCSLIDDAAGLTRPLLLVHGLTDDNVVVAHTLRLSAALTVAGRPHQVLPLSGITHMTPQEDVAENLLLLQVAFLREHLQR